MANADANVAADWATLLQHYLDMEQPVDAVFFIYVFVDKTLERTHSKTRTPVFEPKRTEVHSAIKSVTEKLRRNVEADLAKYDTAIVKRNKLRTELGVLTTPRSQFTADDCSMKLSVRIPRLVVDAGKDYFEDRMPRSNADPYTVCEMFVRTVCLE
ncbi:glutamine synthetase 1, mitochondrial [Dermacentor silvarum]|uniref:glutamine synthetase 1, mitochondrial n=1 Tax=Dermacentor silvarum TaxID=543639 RepID=UPI002100C08C|nr:glutamine synthetase 1, mitochondrial [Dermacentor silvarum]